MLLDDSCSGSITAESRWYLSWIVFSPVILATFLRGENVQCRWQKYSVTSETVCWLSPQTLTLRVSICKWLNLQYALKNDRYHLLKFNSITDHFHDRRVRPRERRSSHPAPETFTNKQISPQRENQTLRRNLMSNLCCQVGCRKSALFNLLESMFL